MSHQNSLLELYLAHERDLKVFIRSLVRDRQDFDDVCQTVVLKLLQSFHSYDHQRPFGPWARGIAVNVILNMRRANWRRPTPFSIEMISRISDAFERYCVNVPNERAEALERCLQTIPADSQHLLSLRYSQLLPIAEVAQHVGRTTAATQRALARIRKQLADCIQLRLEAVKGGAS